MPPSQSSKPLLTRLLAMQPLASLHALRDEIQNDLDAAHSQVSRLEGELAEIEEVLSARADETPEGSDDSPQTTDGQSGFGKLSLRQAIYVVMRSTPGRAWRKASLQEELQRRGQRIGGKTPLNTIGSRLIEMAERQEIVRVAPGVYTYPASYEEE